MLKLSHFLGETEHGIAVMPLFGPADREFEKTAAPALLPEVVRYIESLTPRDTAQYVLVNAMGAGEYWGSNVNGDHFPEAALIHRPDDWSGNPVIDRIAAKSWPYGFPTFYSAHPYAHHRNKDSSRAFGEVELSAWNPRMKRVELVVRVDRDKCQAFGGTGVWDKLKAGQYPDVSMGTRVPYDTCSVCLDWDRYHEALQTFDKKRHSHAGQAALEFHKKLKERKGSGIRGLSITRADYCDHAKRYMNKILPDGRKVWVYNDFPRFFDISFVFIGADKTAKVMLFIYSGGQRWSVKPSAEVADEVGLRDGDDEPGEKTSSVRDDFLKSAFLGKSAKQKSGAIDKDTVPSQFAGKAVPVLTRAERDIPDDLIDSMSRLPFDRTLSTLSGMGMVLRPREFQRLALSRLGRRDLADELAASNKSFPAVDHEDPVDMGADKFSPALARLLRTLLADRSAFGPFIERRILIVSRQSDERPPTSHPDELLRKIGAAYNGYRRSLMDLVAHAQPLLEKAANKNDELAKLSSVPVDQLFTPLSVQYLQSAYFNELPFGDLGTRVIQHQEISAVGRRGEGAAL